MYDKSIDIHVLHVEGNIVRFSDYNCDKLRNYITLQVVLYLEHN